MYARYVCRLCLNIVVVAACCCVLSGPARARSFACVFMWVVRGCGWVGNAACRLMFVCGYGLLLLLGAQLLPCYLWCLYDAGCCVRWWLLVDGARCCVLLCVVVCCCVSHADVACLMSYADVYRDWLLCVLCRLLSSVRSRC